MKIKTETNNASLINAIKKDAETCVRCGLCLPHCPTYQLAEDESESPRGRIAIAKAFAEEKIPLTDIMRQHLDHCLSCGACEAMCPAQVPYSQLLINTRELLQTKSPKGLPWLINYLTKHSQQSLLKISLKLYQQSGLQWLARASGLLKLFGLAAVDGFLPTKVHPQNWHAYYPPSTKKQADLALFIGCITNLVDAKTIQRAITLLTSLGYGVYIPKKQTCCGAIHLHHGHGKQAAQLQQQNNHAFDKLPIDTIITLASGCGASLQNTATKKVLDINTFLYELTQTRSISFTPINKRVLLHSPCTLKNAMGQAKACELLLAELGCRELFLFENQHCCGAAGVNMIQHPDTATALMEALYQEILAKKPDIIVTTNIGCLLHFKRFLREKDQKIPIEHPITLVFPKKMQKK